MKTQIDIPAILANHCVLSKLVNHELERTQPRAGYLRGLAAPEDKPAVREALIELSKAILAAEGQTAHPGVGSP